MVEVRHCPLNEILNAQGLDDLIQAYSKEPSIKNKDLMTPNPQIDAWLKLEDMGLFKAIGAFDGDKVIGVIGYTSYIYPMSGDRVATVDPYFLLKDYRNTWIGAMLRIVLEGLAKKDGIKGLFYGAPKGSALSKQYSRLYEHVNEVYWCNLN